MAPGLPDAANIDGSNSDCLGQSCYRAAKIELGRAYLGSIEAMQGQRDAECLQDNDGGADGCSLIRPGAPGNLRQGPFMVHCTIATLVSLSRVIILCRWSAWPGNAAWIDGSMDLPTSRDKRDASQNIRAQRPYRILSPQPSSIHMIALHCNNYGTALSARGWD